MTFWTAVFVICFLAASPKAIGRWLATIDLARRAALRTSGTGAEMEAKAPK